MTEACNDGGRGAKVQEAEERCNRGVKGNKGVRMRTKRGRWESWQGGGQ